MYVRVNRGIGAVNIFGQRCTPGDQYTSVAGDVCPAPQWWMNLWGITDTSVAVAPAPTGDALTVPPASGEQASALVQSLSDQQLVAQQAANAQGVTSSWWDTVTGGAYSATAGGMPTWAWIALAGLAAFALATAGASPRRYGA
jgi:hypothetical protein